MKNELNKPCNECPFRRDSLPGYLGNYSSPEEFIAETMSDTEQPCHMSVDYEDPDWVSSLGDKANHCYGSLVFFRNICKMSRDPDRPRAEANHDEVFSSPSEFTSHHKGRWNDNG